MLRRKRTHLRWLVQYARQALAGRFAHREDWRNVHLLVAIANHFEPGRNGVPVSVGMRRIETWVKGVEAMEDLADVSGAPLKHTYFFPVEQYDPAYLDLLVAHCRRGFGEVETHLHHGIDGPDSAENLRSCLVQYMYTLSSRHGWSTVDRQGRGPCFVFVHGNWALGNSAGGRFCGVDEELGILRDAGCYLDMTMPSAPDSTQVPTINAIYTPGGPLDRATPHWDGPLLRVGTSLPNPPFFLIQGPLLLNWQFRRYGIPIPRTENGELSADHPPTLERFRLWTSANVHVQGRPEWVFVKLHCHGLQGPSLQCLTGGHMRRFLVQLLVWAQECGARLHFVTAREMANIAMAGVEGADGDPAELRDYNWKLRT